MRYAGVLLAAGSLLVLSSLASAAPAGNQVDAGYDLFETLPGTTYMGIPMMGDPIDSYNFGGTIGVQNTGETDTIVQRLANITPTSPTTSLVMDVLQLVTTAPTTLGGAGPLGFYYVTLQSTDGTGPASTGSLTSTWITPTTGTFTSALDVFFDIHFGALNGPIVAQSNAELTNSGAAWTDMATPGSVQITGANYMLNGNDITNDFWPSPFIENEPGVTHSVGPAMVPEPATLGLLAVTSIAALSRRRRRAMSI